jgi:ABC-type multidrug transport system ATPase subunit
MAATERVSHSYEGKVALEVKRRGGYVPEAPALYDSLTAAEYLAVWALDRLTRLRIAAAVDDLSYLA